eukprot:11212151-Lingulodinium_polyedra.AAC.1
MKALGSKRIGPKIGNVRCPRRTSSPRSTPVEFGTAPRAPLVVRVPGKPGGQRRSQEDALLEGQRARGGHFFQRVASAYVPAIADAESH